MAKTRDFWDTQPFDVVNLNYQLSVPMFRNEDAVANTLKHMIRLNKVPFEASPLVQIFFQVNLLFQRDDWKLEHGMSSWCIYVITCQM